ncbi:TatD family hydrolase [Granulosicoccaceae sp. 1_MG-2023]|nr:TatD family hydrolase [Granulosicoccaceae sp. 1_MG-2023]
MSLQLVDSHCHINFDAFADDFPAMLDNARESDINWMLCVSVDWETYPQVLKLAQTYPHIFASVGVHPNHTEGHEPDFDELLAQAQREEVVAVGETGLDYFRSSGDLSWQHERFIRHIEVAKAVGKPLIIHTREAADDTMRLLREHGADQCGGVLHCFAEDWRIAEQALEIGFYISFSGIVTFKSAPLIQEVARKAPLDRILVETDSPYLAPVPKRGKRNEPAYTRYTAQFVADQRQIPLEALAEATTDNFFRLFSTAVR